MATRLIADVGGTNTRLALFDEPTGEFRQVRNFTNGELGTIEQVEQLGSDIRFTVRCNDGRTVIFNQSEYCDEKGRLYLAQAYASTVYASQGSTVHGDVFVYYTSGMDRSASYVAGSRHKHACHWFMNREEMDALSGSRDNGATTDDTTRLQTLARCMSTNREHCLAVEYLEKATIQSEAEQAMERTAPALEWS